MLPVVAIVGRPNVGKSSLLNALLRRRLAIVDDMAGVTRDRVSARVELAGRWVELVDTGGIGIVDTQSLEEHVEAQISQALEMADALVFLTDGREGCTLMDEEIARILRKRNAPIALAVNKTESRTAARGAAEFGKLGLEPISISAMERQGLDALSQVILDLLPPPSGDLADQVEDPALKIAIVGRVNVGKSTFLNALAGTERAIVSEQPGTTRDTVDLYFEKDGRTLLLTDTAGLKREASVSGSVDFYAQRRAEHAVERAEGVLLMLDATSDITSGDRRIARIVENAVKPVVIVANKWDLAPKDVRTGDYAAYVAKTLPGLHYAPIAFCSAIDRRNVLAVIDTAQSLAKSARRRVRTAEINKILERTRTDSRPPVRLTGNPKIYYGTQIDVNPPTLMLFVNDPRTFRPGYRRFLENRFREALPFKEIPLRVVYKRRKSMFARRDR